jgi:hypothetical protein
MALQATCGDATLKSIGKHEFPQSPDEQNSKQRWVFQQQRNNESRAEGGKRGWGGVGWGEALGR